MPIRSDQTTGADLELGRDPLRIWRCRSFAEAARGRALSSGVAMEARGRHPPIPENFSTKLLGLHAVYKQDHTAGGDIAGDSRIAQAWPLREMRCRSMHRTIRQIIWQK